MAPQSEEQFQASINAMTDADLPDITKYEGLTKGQLKEMVFAEKSTEYLIGLNYYLAVKTDWPVPIAITKELQNRERNSKGIMESTMFKSFTSFNDLLQKTAGYSINAKLHGCGWCVRVTKKALKQVAGSMKKSNLEFTGKITMASGGHKWVQVEIF